MINRYCWRRDSSLGTVSLYGVCTMEIIFGGKPAEATYHKEKLRNERVRDNKMKCVKAVTVANWSEVAKEDKAKRWRERERRKETQSVDVQLWTVETKRHIAVSPCLWLPSKEKQRIANAIWQIYLQRQSSSSDATWVQMHVGKHRQTGLHTDTLTVPLSRTGEHMWMGTKWNLL